MTKQLSNFRGKHYLGLNPLTSFTECRRLRTSHFRDMQHKLRGNSENINETNVNSCNN